MYFVDRQKIERTLQYIEKNVEIFSNQSSWETEIEKKALERIAVSCIEGILDTGNAMIDGFIMRDPGSYEDIIDILEDEKVVATQEANNLKEIIRLRKMLVQDYLEINDATVLSILTTHRDTILSFCHSTRTYLVRELGPVTAFKN